MHDRITCTAVGGSGRDCDKEIPEDSPVSLCWPHIMTAYTFAQDALLEAKRSQDATGSDVAVSRRRVLSADQRESVVYYLRFGDRIKIGTSSSFSMRLALIPHDEVLAVEPGSFDLEKQRHQQFVNYHVRNEWFAVHPDLLRHAKSLRKTYPDIQHGKA